MATTAKLGQATPSGSPCGWQERPLLLPRPSTGSWIPRTGGTPSQARHGGTGRPRAFSVFAPPAPPRRGAAVVPALAAVGLRCLSLRSASRTRRPRASATRAGSPCARAAATRRTGRACSRATTSWPWASAAATCSRSAVSAGPGWGCGGGRAEPEPSPPSPARHSAARRALPHVLHRQEIAAVHPLLPGLAGVGAGRGARGEGARGRPLPALPHPQPPRRESRAHCVDLESAYVQGCERLEQAVLAVKALQAATREAIALLQAMVEEVRRSAEEEAAAIHALFDSVQEKLAERKALLLQAVQSQYEEKDQAFKEQLSHLATLLPTLQIHLVICSSFLSLANKAEFLDLGYELMERLQGVVTRPHRLRPAQSSKIASDYRAEFARCLEPLLLLGPRRATGAQGGANTLAGGSGPKVLMGPSCPSPVRKVSRSPVQKPTLPRSISTKVLLADGEDTPFAEHCRHYEDSYRGLQAEVQNLKDQVQELHRDLTKHHSLIRAEIMADILHRSLRLDAQIDSEYASVEGMRAVFQEIWEESYQRLAGEQEIYEAQLRDLFQLKQENAHLTTITKHITPYVRSIAKVKERLEPRCPLAER
uniref:Ring finger protein 207 n=1 Tax=Oryctolagus cuniculus TaxID=9986 RepID=A0A5F9CG13_RABIT